MGKEKVFKGGGQVRHNLVTSQINLMEVPKARPFLGVRGMPPENFEILHLKDVFLCILETSFSIMLLRDSFAGETKN